MPKEGVNEVEYGTADTVDRLDPEKIEKYWRDVSETLEQIFGEPNAVNKVRRLREMLKGLPEQKKDTELHFYHLDPFQVAADLAGSARHLVSPQARAEYIRRKNLPEKDRPDDDSVLRAKPEDLIPSD